MILRGLLLLAFFLITTATVAQLAASHPKVLQTEAVLKRLATAFGINSDQLPKLKMYHSNKMGVGRIAYLENVQNTLVVDEALFDICERISPKNHSALAFVIGHELAHLALGHEAHLSFAEKNKSVNIPKISVQQEEKADLTGLQYAYLAGYNPEPKLALLFSSLYKHYGLQDNTSGYPSKEKRIEQAKLAAPQFRREAMLFAVGQVLYCKRDFLEATQCFKAIAKSKMPTKEMYNNLGLCRLQLAIALKKDYITDYFVLPLEFDPRNRLLSLSERGDDPQQILWKNYLKEAQEAFEKALQLDPMYFVALQNKAIGAVLEKNYYKALGFLQEKPSNQDFSASALTIRAIAFCGLSMWLEAEQDFAAARKMNAFQAVHNQTVFLQIKADPTLKKLKSAWKTLQTDPNLSIGCLPSDQLFLKIEEKPATFTIRGIVVLKEVNPTITIMVSPDYQTIVVKLYSKTLLLQR